MKRTPLLIALLMGALALPSHANASKRPAGRNRRPRSPANSTGATSATKNTACLTETIELALPKKYRSGVRSNLHRRVPDLGDRISAAAAERVEPNPPRPPSHDEIAAAKAAQTLCASVPAAKRSRDRCVAVYGFDEKEQTQIVRGALDLGARGLAEAWESKTQLERMLKTPPRQPRPPAQREAHTAALAHHLTTLLFTVRGTLPAVCGLFHLFPYAFHVDRSGFPFALGLAKDSLTGPDTRDAMLYAVGLLQAAKAIGIRWPRISEECLESIEKTGEITNASSAYSATLLLLAAAVEHSIAVSGALDHRREGKTLPPTDPVQHAFGAATSLWKRSSASQMAFWREQAASSLRPNEKRERPGAHKKSLQVAAEDALAGAGHYLDEARHPDAHPSEALDNIYRASGRLANLDWGMRTVLEAHDKRGSDKMSGNPLRVYLDRIDALRNELEIWEPALKMRPFVLFAAE